MSAKHTQFPWLDVWLLTLSFGCLFTGLSMAFYYAPVLEYNGLPWWSQKIFYIHLPVAWGGLGGMSLVLISAIAYLKTRNKDWDALSVSASEVCFLYCTLVLCTGPIWGRPSWNTYWKWEEPRLMSFLALWLILAAYFLLRRYGARNQVTRVASATLGILGALSVPFVYLSVKYARSIHPMLKPKDIDPRVRLTVWVCNFAFFFLFVVFLRWRTQLERAREQVYLLQQAEQQKTAFE